MNLSTCCGNLLIMMLNYKDRLGSDIGLEIAKALNNEGIQYVTSKYGSKKVYKIVGNGFTIKILGKDCETQESGGDIVGRSGWVIFTKHPDHWFVNSIKGLVALIRAYS